MNFGYGFIIVGLLYLTWVITTIGYRGYMYDFELINMNSSFRMKDFSNIGFKTGDLIMFRYDCSKASLNEYFDHILILRPWPQLFSHIGMVVEINGSLYIAHKTFCDVLDINNNCIVNKSGLYPLWDFIDNYKGDVYYAEAHESKTINSEDILNKINQLNNLEFIVDKITVIDYLNRTDIANRKGKTISCSGYIHELLQYLGRIDDDSNSNHTTPAQVFDDAKKYYYDPVIVINKYKLEI